MAATRSGGPARTAVRGLKYAGWRHLADLCAEPMAGVLAAAAARGAAPAALVPVPLHPARRRARGFNQALLLAEALGHRTALPVADVLVRVRPTAPQPGLGRAARAANLAGAFRAQGAVPPRVALVDDVATSGATLAAAAAVLLAAGAETVTGVSFALALDPALR
ncbi:MAG TPA: ComF family protein [Gemmatimonadota bacterium]|nr:ComF family protein [Gemmatimonadota bacterium]